MHECSRPLSCAGPPWGFLCLACAWQSPASAEDSPGGTATPLCNSLDPNVPRGSCITELVTAPQPLSILGGSGTLQKGSGSPWGSPMAARSHGDPSVSAPFHHSPPHSLTTLHCTITTEQGALKLPTKIKLSSLRCYL